MPDMQNDFMLAYQDSCSGPTLLLIHGFPLNSSLWEPQLEDLSDTARMLAPDLRGFGLSGSGDEPYSMALMADDCMGLLDALGVQEPVVVCGLSMGGYIAFEFYRRFSDWVSGMILVSTRAEADTPEGKKGRDQMAEQAREDGPEIIAQTMLPKLLAPETYERDEDLVGFVRDMMESSSVDGIAGALMAMKERPDSTETLGEIDVPTLIIHGDDDQIVPLEAAEKMRDAIPEAELVLIPGAGHLPNLEQAEAFNEVVWDFLETLKQQLK